MSENGKKKKLEELKLRVEKLEEQVSLIHKILELVTLRPYSEQICDLKHQYKEL